MFFQMVAVIGQTQVQVGPSLADSIFPEIDEMLEDADFQRALGHVGASKNMERYRSRVDFLFCELFPRYRYSCQRFYAGNGPQLRHLPDVTPDKIRRWQIFMKGALLVAREALEQQRRLSWSGFRGLLSELSGPANDG